MFGETTSKNFFVTFLKFGGLSYDQFFKLTNYGEVTSLKLETLVSFIILALLYFVGCWVSGFISVKITNLSLQRVT